MSIYDYQQENARDYAYATLKEKILSWELKPGEKISEQELSKSLGISRTPVREAFIQLASERLVEIRPQRGTFISRINIKNFTEDRFIRHSLEFSVMKLLSKNKSAAFFRKLSDNIAQQLECAQTGDFAEYLTLDDSFHRAFYEEAGKMATWAVTQSLEVQCRRVRRFTLAAEADFTVLIGQHQEIMRDVLQGDMEALEKILTVHTYKLLDDLGKIKKQHREYFV